MAEQSDADRNGTPSTSRPARSKTRAAALALLFGVFGAHRFYLRGARDGLGWLSWLPALAGAWGLARAARYGLGDGVVRIALPLLGVWIALATLQAVMIALTDDARFDARWNASAAPGPASGWGAVLVAIASLLLGTSALMGALAFTLQGWFGGQ